MTELHLYIDKAVVVCRENGKDFEQEFAVEQLFALPLFILISRFLSEHQLGKVSLISLDEDDNHPSGFNQVQILDSESYKAFFFRLKALIDANQAQELLELLVTD